MSESVVVAACRTPIGRFQRGLSTLSATDLGAIAIRAAVERAGLPSTDINEIIMGNVLSAGVGQAPARQAALRAGLPPEVAAVTINKVCGSGLKAIMLADQAIRCGDAQVIVAGGMESMSNAPWLLRRNSATVGNLELVDAMLHDGLACAFSGRSMGEIADALAERDGISRAEQDRYAAQSHARALTAISDGLFDAEVVPVTLRQPSGEQLVSHDEGPRQTTLEQLAALRGAFGSGGVVTAGNASMISDGAAALVVTSADYAAEHGLEPLARIVSTATSGTQPDGLFVAPVAAIEAVARRGKIDLANVDLLELNEAFAVQMLACLRRLDLDESRVNLNGGAIALGHPIGASGARIATTLIHSMQQRSAAYGIASACLGGGNAVAALFARSG
ncbi:acetyl-CoA C-acyltransferase [bacterium]|nr:acetyl-CoA C-acyltransferase [bacterium]